MFKVQVMSNQHGHQELEYESVDQLKKHGAMLYHVTSNGGQTCMLQEPELARLNTDDIENVLITPCLMGG